MKAKDTVMNDEQKRIAWCKSGSIPVGLMPTDSIYVQVIAEAQAEISFKAGIKEVGEWLDTRKEFISYHYFKVELHDSELEALKQGKIPNSRNGE